ncbi:MAG: F0F1 ATP synthase subunit B [Clostridia bacterium]|nr:F0F1 ATP synthase subunit B [Clostridia bacterium]
MEVQTLDVISVNVWSILISLCNLLILYFIFKKLLFGRVKKIMAERKQAVQKVYDDASRAREEAENDRDLYKSRLEQADEAADRIMEDARIRARAREAEIIEDAKRRASDTMRRADESIELDRRRAVNELKDEISGLSVDIAEKVIEKEIDPDDHRRLIDGFIDSIWDGEE